MSKAAVAAGCASAAVVLYNRRPIGEAMNRLPIDDVLPALRQALASATGRGRRHGASKTTRVPLALLGEPLAGRAIDPMLEPRRLAARAAAERLARRAGREVGETVGYRIRLDSKVGPRPASRWSPRASSPPPAGRPALEGVGLVIFDEFHEPQPDADLALALTLNGRASCCATSR